MDANRSGTGRGMPTPGHQTPLSDFELPRDILTGPAMDALDRLNAVIQEVHADESNDGRFDAGEAAQVAALAGPVFAALRRVVLIAKADAKRTARRSTARRPT